MSALVSDGNYHSVGYGGLDRDIVGGGISPCRTYEGDRMMHFFGTDSYTETGTYDNLDEKVLVLRYSEIIQIKAFKQIKNIHKEIKPGLLVTFKNGVQLLITLDTEDEVQDLAKFLRLFAGRCKKEAEARERA